MRSAWLAATLAILLAVAACGGGGSSGGDDGAATSAPEPAATEGAAPDEGGEPGDVVISITDGGFQPAELTVASGTRLVIRNDGSAPHSMLADEASDFNSELIDPGGQAEIYAIVPGTYPFHCEAHPDETGTLTIEE